MTDHTRELMRAELMEVVSDGRGAAVADFWLQPLIDKFGMKRDAAKELQQQFAEFLVSAHNGHSTPANNDAAPDLLEHLKRLVRFAEDAPRLDFNEDKTLSWLQYELTEAAKTIAKAEGH